MYKTLGNIVSNPQVGLLFLNVNADPKDSFAIGKLRVNGHASLSYDTQLVEKFPGARLVILIEPTEVFPNCPRYLPKLKVVSRSPNCPRKDYEPPDAAWKARDYIKPVIHETHKPDTSSFKGYRGNGPTKVTVTQNADKMRYIACAAAFFLIGLAVGQSK